MRKPGRKPLPKDVKRSEFLKLYGNERERMLVLRAAREDGLPPAIWARRVLVRAAEAQALRGLST